MTAVLKSIINTSLISYDTAQHSQPLNAGLTGGALFEQPILSFTMQAQTQSNWCWAATSTSVSLFYTPTSSWTQCKVASATLPGGLDCCNNPDPCNQSYYLNLALTCTNNYNSMVNGTLTFAATQTQINNGKVVGARIGWDGGGGHFVVIYGYAVNNGTNYYYIADPIYGKSICTEDNFNNAYQTTGHWTHSYLTQPPTQIQS